MNNAELIKAMRYHADATIHDCDGCPYQTIHKTNGTCIDSMISAAADALEAAERLLDQNTKRCEALRKQMREANESYEKHINELEAQIPKEGEWHGGQYDFYCSQCGVYQNYYTGKTNYCPNCGARMKGEQE